MEMNNDTLSQTLSDELVADDSGSVPTSPAPKDKTKVERMSRLDDGGSTPTSPPPPDKTKVS